MSRHALIYCAVLCCSYKDGCDRLRQKGFTDKISKLQYESIINGAVSTNYLFVMIFAGFAIYGIQRNAFQCNSAEALLAAALIEVFMLSFLSIVCSLVTTSSDFCFLENPNLLNRKYRDIYNNLEKVKYL